MENIESHVRGLTARLERLESEVSRLNHDLSQLVEARQSDQDRLRKELAESLLPVSRRLSALDELAAQLEGLGTALRAIQASNGARDERLEALARGLESAWARAELLDNRLTEHRKVAEETVEVTGSLRGDLDKAFETLNALREHQSRIVTDLSREILVAREGMNEPAKKLERVEEAQRAGTASLERVESVLVDLRASDESLRASIEKLGRSHSENNTGLKSEIEAVRADLDRSITTLKQLSDERVTRTQSDLEHALSLAAEARSTASGLLDTYSRLRSQLEAAIYQLTMAERQRLERAAEHARQELQAYDERIAVDGSPQVRGARDEA